MQNAKEDHQPKLLDQVRQVLRLHHYSIHTERSYIDWIVRFVRFHRMRSREDLYPAESKIEAFLTDLAINGNVAPSTQNQAMNALVFLYKRVLRHTLDGIIDAVRANRKVKVPVVMTRDEVAAVITRGAWRQYSFVSLSNSEFTPVIPPGMIKNDLQILIFVTLHRKVIIPLSA